LAAFGDDRKNGMAHLFITMLEFISMAYFSAICPPSRYSVEPVKNSDKSHAQNRVVLQKVVEDRLLLLKGK